MKPLTKPASKSTQPATQTMRRAANEDLEATDPLGQVEVRERRAAAKPGELAAAARAGRFGWSPPTRRHFLGLVLAAGAISLGGEALRPEPHQRSTWTGKTRWIGHC
jgi:hypothetical protein